MHIREIEYLFNVFSLGSFAKQVFHLEVDVITPQGVTHKEASWKLMVKLMFSS